MTRDVKRVLGEGVFGLRVLQGFLLVFRNVAHLEVGLVVFEVGVREVGEDGVTLKKGLQQVYCFGMKHLRKHVLSDSPDLLVVVFLENGLDFEAVLFLVLVGAQNQELVFGGEQEVEDCGERDKNGEEVHSEDFLQGNVNVDFLELDVLDVQEVGEGHLFYPTGLQETLGRLDWDLLETMDVQTRLSSFSQQRLEGVVKAFVHTFRYFEKVQKLLQESAVFAHQTRHLFLVGKHEAERPVRGEERLNFLAKTVQKLECTLPMSERLSMIIELGVAGRELQVVFGQNEVEFDQLEKALLFINVEVAPHFLDHINCSLNELVVLGELAGALLPPSQLDEVGLIYVD